ncbi:MAG: hypothetical protein CL748_02900 [Chloroflexi bacterium]|nr:hypothetical protein [Chloroflexota bacterium]
MIKKQISNKNFFYGWLIVLSLFFTSFLTIGSRQGFGIFVKTWEDEWQVTTAAISFAASMGWLVNGFSQPLLGRLADLYGARLVIIVSLIIMSIATALISLVNSVFGLLILYGFITAFFSGGVSPATVGVIVSKWFIKKRGTAMAVVMSGGSIGSLVIVPFLSFSLLEFGWRSSWMILGVFSLVIGVPLMLLFVKNKPEELNMLPDGVAKSNKKTLNEEQVVGPYFFSSWISSMKTKPMWDLSLSYFVCGITTGSISVHFIRWAVSEDITTGTAALAFGLLSIINALGVIFIGLLSDKFQRKNLLGIVYLVRGLAFASIVFLPGNYAIWSFAIIGGASWLATVPLTASLTSDIYGLKNMGTLFGISSMSHQIGGAGAVILFGWSFTKWGTYDYAFLFGVITLIFAGIISLSLPEKSKSIRYINNKRLIQDAS